MTRREFRGRSPRRPDRGSRGRRRHVHRPAGLLAGGNVIPQPRGAGSTPRQPQRRTSGVPALPTQSAPRPLGSPPTCSERRRQAQRSPLASHRTGTPPSRARPPQPRFQHVASGATGRCLSRRRSWSRDRHAQRPRKARGCPHTVVVRPDDFALADLVELVIRSLRDKSRDGCPLLCAGTVVEVQGDGWPHNAGRTVDASGGHLRGVRDPTTPAKPFQ